MNKSRQSPKRPTTRPLSDIEEAESALADIEAPVSGRKRSRGNEQAELRALKSQVTAWTAERSFQTFRGLACAVAADLDMRSLVKQILETSVRTLSAERGVLFLGQGDNAGLVSVLAINVHGEELRTVDRVSRTILEKAKEGVTLLTQDALRDARLVGVESVELNQIRSILCIPLTCRSGRKGALYLDAPAPDAFQPDSLNLISAVAEIAACALENARIFGDLLHENAKLRRGHVPDEPFSRIVGSSSEIDALRRQARVASQLDAPILIRGERGTGRQHLARVIHDASPRALQPFVSCDCSAVTADLLKGVLLGRTGVAAAGSYVEEIGLVRSADKGTLFLAEAESLGVDLGNQLAAILRQGFFRSMGGRRDVKSDVRLVLGTSRHLEEEVRRGRFSQQLYRAIQGLSLYVPPLRERLLDLPELAAHFLTIYAQEYRGPESPQVSLSPNALKILHEEMWPGNVGELKHVVRRMLLFSRQPLIEAHEAESALIPLTEEESKTQGPWSGLTLSLEDWEKEAVRQAMIRSRGNMTSASRMLGVHRNTLVRKVREFKLRDKTKGDD